MKASRYNWVLNEEDTAVLYNGFTGAIIELDEEHSSIAEILESGTDDQSLNALCEQDSEMLRTAGFLIDDDFDERFYLQTCVNQLKYKDFLTLTAVVTRRCNFNCTYCSQSEGVSDSGPISDSTLDKLVSFLDEVKPSGVHTTLYGGEPLLYPERCIEILSRVRGKFPDSQSMVITNGFLLDQEVARELFDLGLKSAQVTIDGPELVHDSRRMLKSGKGTFLRIVENIRAASEFIKIVVRVNRDISAEFNYSEFRKSIRLNDNVYVYSAPTSMDHSQDYETKQRNLRFLQEGHCPEELFSKRLNARFTGCAANTLYHAVILPEGRLVRCWNQVADPTDSYEINRMGMISSFKHWAAWDPLNDSSPCFDCKMLPTCGGGCSDRYGKTLTPQCRYTKESYLDFIRTNYHLRATGQPHSRRE